MFDVVIAGAGGFGREVYQWAKNSFQDDEFKIKGFLDDDPKVLDNFDIDVGIIGGLLQETDTYEVKENDRFIIAVGNIAIKKKAVSQLKNMGAKFLTLIHPTAIVSDTAKLGEGAVICPFATVSDSVVLDDFAMLNFYASCGHDARVGKYCILSPYATLNGFAVIEDEVFLGTHAAVALYKKVGCGSKISANSVAMDDVPAHSLVYGVPGKYKVIFSGTDA